MEGEKMRETKKQKAKKTFHYCMYLRKSSEEEDSRSIGNQKEVLEGVIEDIIANDPFNNYVYVDTFKDENYTGTDSERPDFKRMLQLMAQGKINMIVVTDLSRLSRNISESINYIQSVFVMLDIRFISYQLPTLDSYLNPDKIYSLEVPIQSMMNENHCAETSIKVRRTFDRLRADGKFIGSFAGYGWVKSPDDKHKLLIDEEAKEVMHLMKDLLYQYNSCSQIAKKLNEKGILSPAGYKKSKGMKHNSVMNNIDGSYLWSGGTVRKMLSRPENVGDLVQGRQKVKSYKIHTKVQMPETEWYVTKDGCPAIFTREEQSKINKLLAMNFREMRKEKEVKEVPMDMPANDKDKTDGGKKEPYLFSGFVRCPDCNRAMNRKGMKKTYGYYICSTYKNYGTCSKHSIREDELAKIVYAAIKQQIDVSVEMSELIQSINETPIMKKKNFDYHNQKKKLESELYKIAHYQKGLYQDFKDGLISKEEYLDLKKDYTEQAEQIRKAIENVETELSTMQKVVEQKDMYLEHFIKHQGFEKLNRDMLIDLIDVIYIYENKNVKIKFSFEDEYKNLITYMEEGKNLLKSE